MSPCYSPRCHQRPLLSAELVAVASGGVCCVSSAAGHGETKRNIYDVTTFMAVLHHRYEQPYQSEH